MNTKTMEGLIGAGTNMDLVNTPMRVFKEARRKGDTATMERAMGYASEFAGKAEEYRVQADEGTREEAKKAREEAEQKRVEVLEKRREERRELEEKLAAKETENSTVMETETSTAAQTANAIDAIVDTLEISEAGRILSEEHIHTSVSE